jgi:hypothetical protein
MTITDEVTSTFQGRPAYRYIRRSDRLPTYAQLADKPLEQIMGAGEYPDRNWR